MPSPSDKPLSVLYFASVFHSARESALTLGTANLAIGGGNGTAEGALTQGMGTVLDLTDRGLGVQSIRYSMIVEDGTVTQVNLEEGGAFELSGRGYFPLVALKPSDLEAPHGKIRHRAGSCARKTLVYCVATVCSSMTLTCRARHMPSSCVPPCPCRYPWNRYLCGIGSSGCLGDLYRRRHRRR